MKNTLSPKELARALDVSESSLKRWVDSGAIEATRTEGGHRRIPITEAIRFIRDSHLELVRPEVLGFRDLTHAPVASRAPADTRLLEYLRAGEVEAARGWILWRFLQGESAAALCDGPIRLAMTTLGESWETRPGAIFLEHRATDICLQALNQLRTLTEAPVDAPVILGGAPDGDPFILPSVMAATSLGLEGFQAVNLGPECPPETLIASAEHYDVSLLWLSITSEKPTRERLEHYVERVLEAFPEKVALMVGGRAAHKIRHVDDPRILHGDSMAELVTLARGYLGAERVAAKPPRR